MRLRAVLKVLGLGVVVAIAAGVVYEQVGQRQDRKRLPRIGQSVDIGGRSLNIYCSGEGGPPVILEAASGLGYVWSDIQPEIAKFTRACWYNRAGIGRSEPGPFPQTSAAIARDLHELLRRAGIPPPYVLVGHSFGGMCVRVYNGIYPTDVAGMVLVDSAHEDEPKRAPKAFLGPTAPRYLWYPLHLLFQTMARIGLVRLRQPPAPRADASQMTRDQIIQVLQRQPQTQATQWATGVVLRESAEQARAAAGLGNRPLIVLTAGKPFLSRDPEAARRAAAYHQVWMHEMQAQLARLSTRGRQVIVENSGHGIPTEAPQAVIDAVREVVTEARAAH